MPERAGGIENEVVSEVWTEARRLAATSRRLKGRFQAASRIAVTLGVLGAAMGTAAGTAAVGPDGTSTFFGVSARVLAGLSALSLAVAAYVGRQLLAPTRETEWFHARMQAEALTRAVWRRLMKVPPYDGADADPRLFERAEEMRSAVRGGALLTPRETTTAPSASTVDEYIEQRVEPQIAFYETRIDEAGRMLTRARAISFTLGLLAVILGLSGGFGAISPPAWIGVITTASAAVAALVGTNRLAAVAPLYQTAAFRLRGLKAEWHDSQALRRERSPAGSRAAQTEFVEACEQVMAQENESWRAEVTESPSPARELLKEVGAGAPEVGGEPGGSRETTEVAEG